MHRPRRRSWHVLASGLALWTASGAGCALLETPTRSPQPTIAFVLNGTAAPLRIDLGGERITSASPAADFSPLIYADSRTPLIVRPGAGSALVGADTVRFARDPFVEERLTFVRVVAGAGDRVDAQEVMMPSGVPAAGTTRLRFVNLSRASGRVDLWAFRDSDRAFERFATDIPPGSFSDAQTVRGGTWRLLSAAAAGAAAPPPGLDAAPEFVLPSLRDAVIVLFEEAGGTSRLAVSPVLIPRPGPDTACRYPCGLPTGGGTLRSP